MTLHPNFEDHHARAGRRIKLDHYRRIVHEAEAEEVSYSENRRFVRNAKRRGTRICSATFSTRRAPAAHSVADQLIAVGVPLVGQAIDRTG